jgi:hypothetical protein
MSDWELFDRIYLAVSTISYVIFTLVVTIGGFYDLRYLFRALNKDGKEGANPPSVSEQ